MECVLHAVTHMQSKPVPQQKAPVSDVKFKNEKQAKVFGALSSIHQVRTAKCVNCLQM